MLKIIDGKRYNTETATEVASRQHGFGGDFDRFNESLYRTPKGAWFVAGSGGPNSPYAQAVDINSRTGGEGLRPLSDEQAMAWLENNDETDALDQYFAEAIEDA